MEDLSVDEEKNKPKVEGFGRLLDLFPEHRFC